MNILKAFIFTVFLMGFGVLLSLGIFELIDRNVADSLDSDTLIHYYGINNHVTAIVPYLIIFLLFYRSVFNWNKGIGKIKIINFKTILIIGLIAIGLELFDRPLFDFSKIADHINNIELAPFEFSKRSNTSLFYRGISTLLIAPIFEELFFRKFIFGELLKKYSSSISIVVSSICFSLIHLPSYRNLLPTFIFGIVCCIIYKKTKNIFYTIILHFFANLIWFLLVIYGESYYEWSYGLEYNYIYWISFIIGIVLSYLGIKKITAANNVYN